MPASAAFQNAIAKSIEAADEVVRYGNQVESLTEPLISVRLANVGAITQAQYDAVVAERNARQAAILVIRTNANARKAADATSVDGQADLDAIAAF